MAFCPTCNGPVPPVPIGRPRIFCSVPCRRQMAAMRAELPAVEAEIIHARQQAKWGHFPGTYAWTAHAHSLELAAAELRQRIGIGDRPGPFAVTNRRHR